MSAFQDAEAWEPPLEQLLPVGNHVVKIVEAENSTSSGGYPEIRLKVSNKEGALQDWLVITVNSVGKIAALADAAGVARPTDEDIADPDTLRLQDSWIYRLMERMVGVVVREEQSRKDPTKMRTVIQGYVPPAKIAQATGSAAPFQSAQTKATKDIPF